jgi:hypothetical protein
MLDGAPQVHPHALVGEVNASVGVAASVVPLAFECLQALELRMLVAERLPTAAMR